jgi:pyruvate dehydrogenase E2 component (dihydrolipoamide acetyltransferase)
MQTIIMPKMGDAMEEGTLVRWLKQEGDAVQEGEPIAEIATDKATVEIEAPVSGVLRGIRVAENAVVPVNTPLAYILQEGESLPADGDGKASAPPDAAAAPQPAPTAVAAAPKPAPTPTDGEERVLASPLARKIAAEHGIDLRQVQGTGPNGRIVERDVLAYLESRKATVAPRLRRYPRLPSPPRPPKRASKHSTACAKSPPNAPPKRIRPSPTSTSRWKSIWKRRSPCANGSTNWTRACA